MSGESEIEAVDFGSIAAVSEHSSPTISLVDVKNFLENVDDEILYVDGSIKIPGEKLQQGIHEADSPIDNKLVPTSLNSQFPLPLKDTNSLCFLEVLRMSKLCADASTTEIIPKYDEIEEKGIARITSEELNDGNLLIYSSFQMTDEAFMGIELLSVVDKNLQLVHEKRIERCLQDGSLIEKSIHIIAEETKAFRLIKSLTKGDKTEQWKSDVKWSREGDFLSHGANIWMTRRLVIDGFQGDVLSRTYDIDGAFILSRHQFHEPSMMAVHDKPVQVQQVDRLNYYGERIKTHSSIIHSTTGNLLREKCGNCSLMVHIKPSQPLHENWEKDAQLQSMFQDFKAKRSAELKLLLADPQNRKPLRDYVWCLVKNKPQSAMNFAVDFVRKLERDANVLLHQTSTRRHQQNST